MWTLTLALYFVCAAVLGAAGRRLGRWALLVAGLPFIVHLAATIAIARDGTPHSEVISWVPDLGLAIGFRVGGFGVVLSALVAGIGSIIVAFSRQYFGAGPRLVRFLALLALFTGGMAGIVTSDELFGLFLFWEVTTVASYLLIGFDHHRAEARAAALQAVLVTGAGGLSLLAGFVVLSSAAGTTSIAAMTTSPPTGTGVTVALVLIMLGAFTKSAQTPFHFWLPGAMAAPTPASAYLHSATMVKAGVVLLAMFAPIFSAHPLWEPVVVWVGLTTMVVGGVAALGQRDLKLLLAHGTVSQLGFMMALIGLGLVAAALAVLVAHALFKAGLFLIVGTIDKITGTRDIDRLSGLGRSAPALAATAAVLTSSMAAVPPLLGFAAKEAAFDALVGRGAWWPLLVAAVASAVTVMYSIRFWWGAFATTSAPVTAVERRWGSLVAGSGLLAFLSLSLGLSPDGLGEVLADAADQSLKLVLWPGITTALGVSAAVLVLGAGSARLLAYRPAVAWRGLSLDRAYVRSLWLLNRTADRITGIVQSGSLPVYLAVILGTVVTVPTLVWLTDWEGNLALPIANGVAEVVLSAIAVAAAVAAARATRRLAAVLSLGAVGYAIAGLFVTFGAPDLALTQLLVETLTVAVFALVLIKLPRRFGVEPASLSRRLRIAVAGAVGVFAALAGVAITTVTPDRSVAEAYVENAVAAGGANVVNVILTNFRALDTLGEITVLAAAALGVGALVAARPRVAGRTETDQGTSIGVPS